MSSTDVLAIVCLAAVVLTPPRRSRRISRIQWSAYTEGALQRTGTLARMGDPVAEAGVSLPGPVATPPPSAYALSVPPIPGGSSPGPPGPPPSDTP